MTLASGSRLGPYEIISPLGAGGMGEVFKARDTRLGRSVAIKVLPAGFANDERFRTRFEREAKAISQLNHPHICTLHDIGQEQGTSYLVMELLDGESLAERIARGPLPLRDVLRYGAEIAGALDRAHRTGLVHRDLKPGNVMITKSGAKLLDFGLAGPNRAPLSISATAPTARQPITAEGTIVGTLPYMSPEQLRGEEVDARTDIHALGVMLYEMVSGKRLFNATNSASLIGQILEQPAPPLSQVQPIAPAELEHIVATCLEKDPDARFQSAADVAHELRWIATDRAPTAAAAPRRTRWWYAVAAVALIGVSAVAGYVVASREHPGAPGAHFTQLTFDPGEETDPSISPDGKFVAFVKTVNGQKDIFLQRVDGRSAINLTSDSSVDDDEPAFSPDGNSIAFRSERDGGGIFVMGATGESARRITTLGFDPSWSPDGKQLVFSAQRTIDPRSVFGIRSLYVADVATGASHLFYDDVDVMQPSWSPHGYRIAFWRADKGQRDIFTIDAAGDPASVVAVTSDPQMDWNPVWSPDGQSLYFFSDRDGTMNLWRVAIDEKSGKTRGPLEPMRTPSPESGFVSVARDTGRLAFQSRTLYGELLPLRFDAGTGKVLMPAAPVLSGSMVIRYPAISPDGKWIAFSSGGAQEDVYVMKSDGTGLRQLTNDIARDRGIGWWPDSSRIVFYSNRAGEFDAWTIRPDGSGLTRISDIVHGVNFPRVSPDQTKMAYISDAGGGAAIADLTKGLPVKSATPLGGSIGARFVPYSWSPDGTLIAGGIYGGRALQVYSMKTKQFTTLVEGARGAFTFLNDRDILFVDAQWKVCVVSVDTRQVRCSGGLPLENGFRPGQSGMWSSPANGGTLLFFRMRAESDIWEMDLDERE